MVPLRWSFVVPAVCSVLLGIREISGAVFLAMAQDDQLLEFVTVEAMMDARFEVLFLFLGGLFLIAWPIAYRVQKIRKA